jgi:hypothetical protein
MICPSNGCGKWTAPGAGCLPCAEHKESAGISEVPPADEQPSPEITAMFERHRAEVDNGLWPRPDCPVCQWIISKPSAEQRWLAIPWQHTDVAYYDIAA